MKKNIFIVFLFTLFFCFNLFAEQAKNEDRYIDLDWESVQGASGYEIELFEYKDRISVSRGIFKTEIPKWTKAVAPGKYSVKIRTLDSRDVAGEWSDHILVTVKLSRPLLLLPRNDEIIESTENMSKEVVFQWEESSGANFYRLNIFDEDNNKFYTGATKNRELKVNFFKHQNYTWEVLPLYEQSENPNDNNLDLKNRYKLSLIGGILKSPKLRTSVTTNELVINWNKIENADNYNFKIVQGSGGKRVALEGKTKNLSLFVPKNRLTKGSLIIQVSSSSKGYRDSEWNEAIYDFDFKTIKVVQQVDGNENIEITKSFALFVSAPFYEYTIQNFSNDSSLSQNIRGYKVDLTMDYKLMSVKRENELWYSAGFDFSAVADSYVASYIVRSNHSLIKKYSWNNYSIKPSIGLSFFRAPALGASGTQTTKSIIGTYSTFGPIVGSSFTYNLTPTYKFSFAPMITYHALAISTPDKEKFVSNIGIDLDFKFSYSFLKNIDLSARAHYMSHDFKSQAIVGGTSFAQEGDVNSNKMSSTYFMIGSEMSY